MTTELLRQARAGDGEAFSQLVDPYRRELQVHCYRTLGSFSDAEDLVQETLIAAWQGLPDFREQASFRSWLYRIATNRCLNWLRSARRHPAIDPPRLPVEPPEPTRLGEVTWLEPYPDALLAESGALEPGPDVRYETREAISLAFVTALQLLPPRQRVVLILRDVLGFRAAEVAEILDVTEEAVTSALKRARATMARDLPRNEDPPPLNSAAERQVLNKLVDAWENGDIEEIVALMTEDVWVRMPPVPLEYQGRELAGRFLATIGWREGRRYRLIRIAGANGQPAFGLYQHDPASDVPHIIGLLVITLAGNKVSAITRFDNSVVAHFGLPRALPAVTTR